MAPAAAEAMADVIIDGKSSTYDLSPFDPALFLGAEGAASEDQQEDADVEEKVEDDVVGNLLRRRVQRAAQEKEKGNFY